MVIAPAWVIYRKSKTTTIVGTEVFPFSYDGVAALKIIKALKTSRIVFSANNGLEFSLSLADLCLSSPEAFVNLSKGVGCTVNEKALEKLIREASDKTPKPVTSCNDEKLLNGVIKLACSDEVTRKKIESQFTCSFTCP